MQDGQLIHFHRLFLVFFLAHYGVLLRYAVATSLWVHPLERSCSEASCALPDRDEVSALAHWPIHMRRGHRFANTLQFPKTQVPFRAIHTHMRNHLKATEQWCKSLCYFLYSFIMSWALIVFGIYASNTGGRATTYLTSDSFLFAVHYAPTVPADVLGCRFIHYPLH